MTCGGHAAAAGLRIEDSRIAAFREALSRRGGTAEMELVDWRPAGFDVTADLPLLAETAG